MYSLGFMYQIIHTFSLQRVLTARAMLRCESELGPIGMTMEQKKQLLPRTHLCTRAVHEW
jgi:hypothetical protein